MTFEGFRREWNQGFLEGNRFRSTAEPSAEDAWRARDEELKEAVAAAEEAALRRAANATWRENGKVYFVQHMLEAQKAILALIPEGNHLARYVADLKQTLKDQLGWMEQAEVEKFVADKVAAAVLAEALVWAVQHAPDGDMDDLNSWDRERLAALRVSGADPLARIREEAKREVVESLGITFVANDGTRHVWPCDEHKGAIVYPQTIQPLIQTGADNSQVVFLNSPPPSGDTAPLPSPGRASEETK